jgi:hypothetical protein
MASTWSALKVELLETGANSGTWGTLTNANLGDAVLGEAITGQATVDFSSDADVTITLTDAATTQAARNLRLNITESSTGIGSVRNLILGSGCQIEKFYLINNTGTGAKTIKNTSGTGISVPAGKATLVFNNGTNVVDAASYFTSLTLGSALPVASGGTNLTSFTANGVVYASSTSALATGSALTFDGTNLGVGSGAAINFGGSLVLYGDSTLTALRGRATNGIVFQDSSATEQMRLTSTGLGIGATPSAWNASFYKVLQVSDRGSSFASNTSSYSTAPYLFIGNNAFSDVASGAGFKYVTTNASAQYRQVNAEHQFFTAASGTAGNAITFTQAMTLDASGRLGIGTSSPATTLHLRAAVCNVRLEDADTSAYANVGVDNSGSMYLQADPANSQASTAIYFATDGTERARIDTSGNLLVGGTAARGTTAGTAHLDLFNGTAPAGTLTNGISLYSDSGDLKFMNAAGDAFDVGYRNIPQNSQSAAYTLVLADAGKHIFHPVGDNNARTFTIPANSSVAFPIGTAITFINMAAANVTIAITTDTLTLSPAGTSGSRTLAQYGSATCIKITSTQWLISGSGLT